MSNPQRKRRHASHRSTVAFTARRSSPEQLPVDPPEHTGNRTPGKKNRRDDLRQY
ncbi:hypothetical protein DY000_02043703 [Brassica cretica]|uniref:Uncharacterized protein n=1 Tax=Brassica cretica TaxID=69181 RepID=A0ABQ7BQ23_BRACR|nr:hypothetical protein DY000_02043703 [Brassica cretica]